MAAPKPVAPKPEKPTTGLPEVEDAIADRATVRKVNDLLEQAIRHKQAVEGNQEKLDECRKELAAIALGWETTGFRHGKIGIHVNGYKTRRSLSAKRLVELGVDPELIDKAYETGNLYLDARLVTYD
jgi:hypothetical protein